SVIPEKGEHCTQCPQNYKKIFSILSILTYPIHNSYIFRELRLYDSSGYVRVGYISGNKLVSSVGGRRVTLYK
ncbi:MAG: hypothetical protein PHR06_16340, partial [Candidatus Cloacimonetes bacterium]|nr:hypothetical protein [Candidatus Cloacimonadota bacterium]